LYNLCRRIAPCGLATSANSKACHVMPSPPELPLCLGAVDIGIVTIHEPFLLVKPSHPCCTPCCAFTVTLWAPDSISVSLLIGDHCLRSDITVPLTQAKKKFSSHSLCVLFLSFMITSLYHDLLYHAVTLFFFQSISFHVLQWHLSYMKNYIIHFLLMLSLIILCSMSSYLLKCHH